MKGELSTSEQQCRSKVLEHSIDTVILAQIYPKQRRVSSKIGANKFLFPAKHCLRKLGDQGVNLKPIQKLLSKFGVCVPYITLLSQGLFTYTVDPELPN